MLSEILPRAQNEFEGQHLCDSFLNDFNSIASGVNSLIEQRAFLCPWLRVISYKRFFLRDGSIDRTMLSRDGLHLSIKGTKTVASVIQKAVIDFIQEEEIKSTIPSFDQDNFPAIQNKSQRRDTELNLATNASASDVKQGSLVDTASNYKTLSIVKHPVNVDHSSAERAVTTDSLATSSVPPSADTVVRTDSLGTDRTEKSNKPSSMPSPADTVVRTDSLGTDRIEKWNKSSSVPSPDDTVVRTECHATAKTEKSNKLSSVPSLADTAVSTDILATDKTEKSNKSNSVPSPADTAVRPDNLGTDKTEKLKVSSTVPSSADTAVRTDSLATDKTERLNVSSSVASSVDTAVRTDSLATDKTEKMNLSSRVPSSANTAVRLDRISPDRTENLYVSGIVFASADTAVITDSLSTDSTDKLNVSGSVPSSADTAVRTERLSQDRTEKLYISRSVPSSVDTAARTDRIATDRTENLNVSADLAVSRDRISSDSKEKLTVLDSVISSVDTAVKTDTISSRSTNKINVSGSVLSPPDTAVRTERILPDSKEQMCVSGTVPFLADTPVGIDRIATDSTGKMKVSGSVPSLVDTVVRTDRIPSKSTEKINLSGSVLSSAGKKFVSTVRISLDSTEKLNMSGSVISSANTAVRTNKITLDTTEKSNVPGSVPSLADTPVRTDRMAFDSTENLSVSCSVPSSLADTVIRTDAISLHSTDKLNMSGSMLSLANTAVKTDRISQDSTEILDVSGSMPFSTETVVRTDRILTDLEESSNLSYSLHTSADTAVKTDRISTDHEENLNLSDSILSLADDQPHFLMGGSVENKVYMIKKDFLDVVTAKRIVENPDQSKVIFDPPVAPKAGEVYVFSHGGDITKADDWKSDQYIWVSVAGYGFPKKQKSFWTKLYYISTGVGDTAGNSNFIRKAYFFKDRPDWPYVLIQYLGNHSVFVQRPHGNSKNSVPYRRTCKSVLTGIRNQTSASGMGVGGNVAKTYAKEQAGDHVAAAHQGILNPRNSEQVRNIVKSEKRKFKVSHDEMFSTVQVAHQLNDYVHECNYYPDLKIVAGSKEILDELNDLLTLESDEPVVLSYDTTFNIGNYFVSPLVFRHVMFKDGKTIPAAFLIHDRKNRLTHETFFRTVTALVPNLEKMKTPIITDREMAIYSAIQKVAPNLTILFCWNHLRRDLKRYLEKQKATSDDKLVYSCDFLALLQCDSLAAFEETETRLKPKWSLAMIEYFDKHYRNDIMSHSAKWILDSAGVSRGKNGITNNMSEGLNTLLKSLANWPGIPLDALITSLHFLQRYKYNEILRGRLQVGDFRLKDIHLDEVLDPEEVEMPKSLCTPEQIVELVRRGDLNVSYGKEEDEEEDDVQALETADATKQGDTSIDTKQTEGMFKSQRAFAVAVIKEKRIWNVPESGSWIVMGSKNDKYAVALYPDEKCSCPSLGSCYHILAAKMSIGKEPQTTKRILNMTQLKQNTKKRQNKQAGKKRPRPIDIYDAEECEINAAPDAPLKDFVQNTAANNLSTILGTPADFATSTPMTSTSRKTPKSILKARQCRTPKKSCKKMRFDMTSVNNFEKKPNIPDEETAQNCLSTVTEEIDDFREDSIFEQEQVPDNLAEKEEEMEITNSCIDDIVRTQAHDSLIPAAASSPIKSPTKIRDESRFFKTPDSNFSIADRKSSISERPEKETATVHCDKNKSGDISGTSFNSSTKTIIIDDLLCDPEEKDKHKRCWMRLIGTNYSVTIGDKFDIVYNKKLTDRVVNFAQQLLKRITLQVNGLQDCCYVPVEKDGIWKYCVKMRRTYPPSCQIHHTGTDHWITSAQDTSDGQIIIFDSSQGFNPRLSKSVEMQLFALYGKGKSQLEVIFPRIQQQSNGVDCGVFSIAYATEFVFNRFTGKEYLEFNKNNMREHLLCCFQEQELTPFPKLKRKLRLKGRPVESSSLIISR